MTLEEFNSFPEGTRRLVLAGGLYYDGGKRFEAACAALTGLLADTEDQADERRQEEREVDEKSIIGQHFNPITGEKEPTVHIRKVRKKVYVETCAEATARLAVEHADALLKALK